MKNYITLLLIGLSSVVFAQPQNDLIEWLDDTYDENDIVWKDAISEFNAYADNNYKAITNITDFLAQFKPKKRWKGPKEFALDRPSNYPSLQKIANLSIAHFKALENELYDIILAYGLEKDQNAFTYLWIYINHINNIPLNDTRPNDMVFELYQLKRFMHKQEPLFEKIALIILTRKIFLENNYIDPETLVLKTYPNTKVSYHNKNNSKEKDDAKNDAEEVIQDFAEVDPIFIGGTDNMVSFIVLNVYYPVESRIMREHGTVYVSFVIDVDGSVSKVEIRKGVTKRLDEEATRIIQLMPKWIPGEQANKFVRINFTLPIDFRLK